MGQQHRAITATTTLFVAAVDSGWRAVDLAGPMGMKPDTIRKRVRDARSSSRPPSGLDLPPAGEPDPMLAVLSTPADEREWLTGREVAELAGISMFTVRNWSAAGLLPNARKLPSNRVLYLRADILRVMRAPRYNELGASSTPSGRPSPATAFEPRPGDSTATRAAWIARGSHGQDADRLAERTQPRQRGGFSWWAMLGSIDPMTPAVSLPGCSSRHIRLHERSSLFVSLAHEVCVDLGSDGRRAVSEALLHVKDREAGVEHEGRGGVTQR